MLSILINIGLLILILIALILLMIFGLIVACITAYIMYMVSGEKIGSFGGWMKIINHKLLCVVSQLRIVFLKKG